MTEMGDGTAVVNDSTPRWVTTTITDYDETTRVATYEEPRLSVVVTTRNDDHGKHQLARVNLFIQSLGQLAHEAAVPTELIIVEWNPPDDHLLRGVLQFHALLPTAIITVPPEIHQSYGCAEVFPLYQMIAKNVGIRRARGEWILATNPDLVFVPEVFQRIRVGLCETCFYRVPRVDVHTQDVPALGCVQDVIAWMQGRPNTKYLNPWLDGLLTEACGDFTLMHRKAWWELRGYAELDMWSPHIDSMLLLQANLCGYQQVVWQDLAAYHLDHDKSLSTQPEYAKQYPTVDLSVLARQYEQARAWSEVARALGPGIQPYMGYNGPDWGYADHHFEVWTS